MQIAKHYLEKLEEIERLDYGNFDTIIKDEGVYFNSSTTYDKSKLQNLIFKLKPWRKGPFVIDGFKINSEWQSNIKFDIIKKYLDIEGKIVADIGCNNGFYMFMANQFRPCKITGFDPYAPFYLQFQLLQKLSNFDNLEFKLEGIDDLVNYQNSFDFLLCLGVIYHRHNPISALKALKIALKKGGVAIVDSFIFELPEDIAHLPLVLSPESYISMSNAHFIPSLKAMEVWSKKAGFKNIEVLEIVEISTKEQRKTEFIDGNSLDDFLIGDKTIEGYALPKRAYFRLTL